MTVVFLFSVLSACAGDQKISEPSQTSAVNEETAGAAVQDTASSNTVETENTASVQEQTGNDLTDEKPGEGPDESGGNAELLQSASVDLNGDGENEQVEAYSISMPSSENEGAQILEGSLVIKSRDTERRITFWKKEAGLTGILSSMQFEDLDKDGADDVFITVPGNGASFSYTNYFMYSYKKDANYSFTSDNSLVDFIEGFRPEYTKGDNRLSITNIKYSFTADIAIEESAGQQPDEDTMLEYAGSTWIEPVCVDISEDSRLALVKGAGNEPEIKVPLPIFGIATVNMIGELDLYYTVDNDFKPVLKRFELLDFKGNDKEIVGKHNLF